MVGGVTLSQESFIWNIKLNNRLKMTLDEEMDGCRGNAYYISSWGTHMDRDRRTRSVYMLKTNSGRSSDIKLL